jgi:hypothetical protein
MNEETIKKIVAQFETLTTRSSLTESDLDRILDDHFKNLLREGSKK